MPSDKKRIMVYRSGEAHLAITVDPNKESPLGDTDKVFEVSDESPDSTDPRTVLLTLRARACEKLVEFGIDKVEGLSQEGTPAPDTPVPEPEKS